MNLQPLGYEVSILPLYNSPIYLGNHDKGSVMLSDFTICFVLNDLTYNLCFCYFQNYRIRHQKRGQPCHFLPLKMSPRWQTIKVETKLFFLPYLALVGQYMAWLGIIIDCFLHRFASSRNLSCLDPFYSYLLIPEERRNTVWSELELSLLHKRPL